MTIDLNSSRCSAPLTDNNTKRFVSACSESPPFKSRLMVFLVFGIFGSKMKMNWAHGAHDCQPDSMCIRIMFIYMSILIFHYYRIFLCVLFCFVCAAGYWILSKINCQSIRLHESTGKFHCHSARTVWCLTLILIVLALYVCTCTYLVYESKRNQMIHRIG